MIDTSHPHLDHPARGDVPVRPAPQAASAARRTP